MKEGLEILFIGESCIVHTVEYKGYDRFDGTRYNEPALIMKEVFENQGHSFTHIPCHRVHLDFPADQEQLAQYDVVILSDVGANTMLLHPDTSRFCKRTANKLTMLAEYVEAGGGLAMVGGYMSFMGIDARAKYKGTIMEQVLPVEMLTYDDRVEVPEGAILKMQEGADRILQQIPQEWPFILGYNRLIAKEEAQVLVACGDDPIITIGTYGKGRTMAYAADCAPHWAPPEMYQWEYYGRVWDCLVRWLQK